MTQGTMLYEGKAKKIFATDQPDRVIQYFKDDATAFNAQNAGRSSTRAWSIIKSPSVCFVCWKPPG